MRPEACPQNGQGGRTLSTTTLNINDLFAALSIKTICQYAECRVLFIVMLNAVMLCVVKLNDVMLKSVMLSVLNAECSSDAECHYAEGQGPH